MFRKFRTSMMIRNAIDSCPDGICFATSGGRPILANKTINPVCYELTGHTVINADSMWRELTELAIPKEAESPAQDTVLCKLKGGSVWQFQKKRLTIDRSQITQYEASDITELYHYRNRLQENNICVSELHDRQRELLENIVQNNLDKELLRAKMRIHDNFGRLLIMTENVLTNKSSEMSESELFSTWEAVISDIKQPVEITRAEFEKATADLLKRTQVKLEQVMADKNITWDDIDELLVIGGSNRMPMVKKMLESLSGKQVKYKVDPDTAVAQGAAIFASTFEIDAESGQPRRDVRTSSVGGLANQITISDVTSQSLGVVLLGSQSNRKYNQVIIPHNSKIPTTCSQLAYTVVDNQTELLVQVTEGNDAELEFVKIVGESTLPIPAYPKGSPVEIIYAYDPDQIVTIEVIDKVANKSLGTFEVDRSSNMSAEKVALAAEIVGKTNVE